MYRNVSAANSNARKILRALPNLIDALLHFLGTSIRRNQLKSRSVENCICILRNMSYRFGFNNLKKVNIFYKKII